MDLDEDTFKELVVAFLQLFDINLIADFLIYHFIHFLIYQIIHTLILFSFTIIHIDVLLFVLMYHLILLQNFLHFYNKVHNF